MTAALTGRRALIVPAPGQDEAADVGLAATATGDRAVVCEVDEAVADRGGHAVAGVFGQQDRLAAVEAPIRRAVGAKEEDVVDAEPRLTDGEDLATADFDPGPDLLVEDADSGVAEARDRLAVASDLRLDPIFVEVAEDVDASPAPRHQGRRFAPFFARVQSPDVAPEGPAGGAVEGGVEPPPRRDPAERGALFADHIDRAVGRDHRRVVVFARQVDVDDPAPAEPAHRPPVLTQLGQVVAVEAAFGFDRFGRHQDAAAGQRLDRPQVFGQPRQKHLSVAAEARVAVTAGRKAGDLGADDGAGQERPAARVDRKPFEAPTADRVVALAAVEGAVRAPVAPELEEELRRDQALLLLPFASLVGEDVGRAVGGGP